MLAVVVVGAVASPGVIGRQLPGTATAVPVADPPRVGDCLTTPPDVPPAPLAVRIAPCAAGRFGEVVAVMDDPRLRAATSRRQHDDDAAVSDDRDRQACGDQVLRYLGLTVGSDHQGFVDSYWQPLAPLDMSIDRPSARQTAAGQHWVSCSFYVHDQDGKAASYRNPARDAYGHGIPPPALAYCLSTGDLMTAESVPCSRPHTAEAFGGTMTARPGLTVASMEASCRVLVARATRMPDITAAGALQVEVTAVHGPTGTSEPGLGSAHDVTGYAGCVISSPDNRQLSGPLLALGGRPVPWAS